MKNPEKTRGDAKSIGLAKTERRRRGLFRPAGRSSQVVTEFQSDAIEVENRTPPFVARATLYCILALIAIAVTWASLSQVDMIVTAQGKLITTRPNLVVQPLETSVIREIHVKVGDRVKKGDLLATLDPTFSQADRDQLANRVAAFDASINRVAAWVIGTRCMIKALLIALLEPAEKLRAAEASGDFTTRLALFEEAKTLAFGTVWEEYCRRQSVPEGMGWLEKVKGYEREVLSKRG